MLELCYRDLYISSTVTSLLLHLSCCFYFVDDGPCLPIILPIICFLVLSMLPTLRDALMYQLNSESLTSLLKNK